MGHNRGAAGGLNTSVGSCASLFVFYGLFSMMLLISINYFWFNYYEFKCWIGKLRSNRTQQNDTGCVLDMVSGVN